MVTMNVVSIILMLLTSSMALSINQLGHSSYRENIRSLEEPPLKSKKHQLQIEKETGLDGKVRSIRLDANEDAPGVRVYGIPKNKLIDSKKMEKSDPKPVLRGDPRGGKVLNNFNNSRIGDDDKYTGHIERVQITTGREEPVKVIKVVKRSTDNLVKNRHYINDLEVAEAKVFRPLFVYRQQVNRRKAQQKKKAFTKKYSNPKVIPKQRPIYYYPNRVSY